MGQSATINCTTNIAVDSIEWRAGSTVLDHINSSDAANLTELEYTIDIVMDDLTELTCVAVTGNTTYNETELVKLEGMTDMMGSRYDSVRVHILCCSA